MNDEKETYDDSSVENLDVNATQNSTGEPNRKLNKFILPGISISLLLIVGIFLYFIFISPNGSLDKYFTFDLTQSAFAQDNNNDINVKPNVPFSKVKLSEIENLTSFIQDSKINFSNKEKVALENKGFFLEKNYIVGEEPINDDFVDMYNKFAGNNNKYYREGDDAVFITSDLALHLYHILIDRSFQSIEENKFQPMLRAMTKVLFVDSIKKYETVTDQNLKDSYKRLAAYYLVPLVVLDAGNQSAQININPEDFETFAQYLDAVQEQKIQNSDKDLIFSLNTKTYNDQTLSDEIYNLAKAELSLIQNSSEVSLSPLFTPLRPDFSNDYSQFTPRSHYTKNSILRSYFIAMMWYGRMGFTLNNTELTRDALLITTQINNLKVNDQDLSQVWSNIATVVDFFVGEVDDLTAYQYTDVIKKTYGSSVSLEDFANNQLLNKFITTAKSDLPSPKIISEVLWVYDDGGKRDELLTDIMQFRFMGQRFTPDAYIINNLTQGLGDPDPETGQRLPTMPTALMPVHVLYPDNDVAKNYLDEWINDPIRINQQNRQSDKVVAKVLNNLTEEFSQYDIDTWSKNIYWRWLDILKALLKEYGTGYPSFMQTTDWQQKNLGTVLGSFTELKHDTLLYAKQSYAELGGGGPSEMPKLPPTVKGYVEPDIEFWNKIINLAETTVNGLKNLNVFPKGYSSKYESFVESSKFFREIVAKELKNEKISDADFEKLRSIDYKFNTIVAPIGGQDLTKKEKRAGIIADIHTDGVKSKILYEATGKPYIVYVAVKDVNGTRLTRGAVFSHYEFSEDLGKRLSDEDWQNIVYNGIGKLPAVDQWSAELVK